MLVIDNALFAAVALAHPAGVSSVVAVFEFKHGQVAKALTCQIFSRVGHGGSLRSIKEVSIGRFFAFLSIVEK